MTKEQAWWVVFFGMLVLWDLGWRGYALWRSARQQDTKWFVPLLIFNTAGILPLIYITSHPEDK